MARVLFIYSLKTSSNPDRRMKPIKSPEYIAMGISYISSVLKQHGHSTSLVVLSSTQADGCWLRVNDALRSFSPTVVCLTAEVIQYPFITKIAWHIKLKYPDIFLLIGGPHVSLNPEEAIQDIYDAVCISEGEYPTLEYVSQLEEGRHPSNIPGLWIKTGRQIERNSPSKFLADLDSLPFPDREIWWPWIEKSPDWRFSVLVGRGCPFNCSYCSNHALRKLSTGDYVRWRSPENIVREIVELSDKYPNNREFYLLVETIIPGQKWIQELCSELQRLNRRRPIPLSFGTNLRLTDGFNFKKLEELFAAFQEANFRFVSIGLESGSERVRREILRRGYSNDNVIQTVALARVYGLQVAFFNLIGLPGETMADFKETVRMNRICQPDWHITSIFFPYPGTDLYKRCLEDGLIDREKMELSAECNNGGDPKRFQVAALNLPGFSREQIRKCYAEFDYYVHCEHRPQLRALSAAVV